MRHERGREEPRAEKRNGCTAAWSLLGSELCLILVSNSTQPAGMVGRGCLRWLGLGVKQSRPSLTFHNGHTVHMLISLLCNIYTKPKHHREGNLRI